MLKDVLQLVPDKPERVPLPDEVLRYLQQHRVPADIIEDLGESSYDDWVPRLLRPRRDVGQSAICSTFLANRVSGAKSASSVSRPRDRGALGFGARAS